MGHVPVLSEALLDSMVEDFMRKADVNLRRDGFVAHGVYGLSVGGGQMMVLEVADIDAPQVGGESGVLLVPTPMREWAPTLREVFLSAAVQATVEVSEYWTFPADDLGAAEAFLRGHGVPPSEHPRRLEGVMVRGSWPMGGYGRVEFRRIVRTPSGAYLRPWTGQQLTYERSAVTSTGWLDACLPG